MLPYFKVLSRRILEDIPRIEFQTSE